MKKYVRLTLWMLVGMMILPGCSKESAGGNDSAGSSYEDVLIDEAASDTSENEVKETGSQSEEKAADKEEYNLSDTPLAYPSVNGHLGVKNGTLCDADGRPVMLQGVSTHGLSWFPQYVNEMLFRELHDVWNVNVVRLAMYTAEDGGYCTGGNKEELCVLIKQGIQYAKAADIYAIIDWHTLKDNNPLDNVDESIKFWDRFSKEYAEYDNVIYEICNEPNSGTDWKQIKEYAEQVIPVIVSNDPDALILIGTPDWCQKVDDVAANPIDTYDNVMYTLHFYAATHKSDIQKHLKKAIDKGVPVFVSEFGITDASGNGSVDIASADEWMEILTDNNISHVCWNLANKNESSSLINADCTKTSGFLYEELSQEGRWLWDTYGGSIDNATTSTSYALPAQDEQDASKADDAADYDSDAETDMDMTKSGNLEYGYEEVNSWESNGETYHQISVTVKNTSDSAVENWEIEIPFKAKSIEDCWGGKMTVSSSGITIKNVDYNGNLQAGATISDIGMIVKN